MFSQEELDKIIKETLPELPADRHSAIVGTVDNTGVGVVAKFTKETTTQTWELDLAVKRNWNNGFNLGTKVIWSF